MKNIKKILALVIAVAMVLAMGVVAFAADEDTFSIKINKDTSDKAAHTYGAYQLFKGDLAEQEGKTILSNVTWGDNVTPATVITELNKIEGFDLAEDATAATVAKAISDANYTNNSEEAKALAEALNKCITGNPKGTVAVAADATSGTITGLVAGYYLVKDTVAVSAEGASTKYILEVVKNVEVTEKASVPTVDKKIAEETPTIVSDYSIGDSIPYTITGTLPGKFAEFKTYKTFTFTDEMSAGLTPPAADAVTVKIGTTNITDLFDVAVNGQQITVSLKQGVDLKIATYGDDNTAFKAGDEIVVSYSAVLNNNAVIGGTGNINTAKLVFSNNPNSDGDGDTGTTPEDKTVVFTYTINALKVEADGELVDAIPEGANPDDYVKVGNKYQKVKALEGAGFTLYKKVNGEWVADGDEITGVTSFEFKGKDVGEYKLVETTVPAGYNKADDIEITVSATYTTDTPPQIATLTVNPETAGFTADLETGVISGKILNEQGAELPTTGGIGTTIFYIVGAILVIGGGILLISKRRMRAE